MKALSNLKIGVRLGLCFGLLALAVLVAGGVGMSTVSTLRGEVDEVADEHLVSVEEAGSLKGNITANAHDVVRHLYVFDGDLQSQDKVAATIAGRKGKITKSIEELESHLATDEQKQAFTDFNKAREGYVVAFGKALELSRKETVDGVEERDASRNVYLQQVVPALDSTVETVDALIATTHEAATEATEAAASNASRGRTTILIVLLLAIAAAASLAVVVTRGIVRAVAALGLRLKSLSEHDLAELDAGLSAMTRGDLTAEATASTEKLEGLGGDEIGQAGETTNELIDRTHGSLASYNAMRSQLGDMIGEISTSSTQLNSASQQMASTSEEAGRAVGEIASAVGEVARGAEQQVRKVESSRELAEEMARTTQDSSSDANETADAARRAREVAGEGADAVRGATDAMDAVRSSSAGATEAIRELGAKSEQITGIVETITGIAEQTNLLALNAAIEAARAGEQGRGFAVVAEEVRKLAEESQQAAASISDLIGEIQQETQRAVEVVEDGAKQTEDGSATVQQAHDAFVRLGESVDDMSSRVERIAAAIAQIAEASQRMQEDMAEVAAVAEQSSASTEQVSASTEETSASTQQIAASAQELSRTAESLESLVGRFTLK
jgi:methyl-accepting chemotaxis protein